MVEPSSSPSSPRPLFVDPADLPELPLAFMNEDHAEEFRLINKVAEALDAHRTGRGALDAVLEHLAILAVHSREDFLREELAMKQAGYSGHATHKAEHDRFLAGMDEEARRFRSGKDAERLAQYLVETVPGWFVKHIRTHDVAAARFIADDRARR